MAQPISEQDNTAAQGEFDKGYHSSRSNTPVEAPEITPPQESPAEPAEPAQAAVAPPGQTPPAPAPITPEAVIPQLAMAIHQIGSHVSQLTAQVQAMMQKEAQEEQEPEESELSQHTSPELEAVITAHVMEMIQKHIAAHDEVVNQKLHSLAVALERLLHTSMVDLHLPGHTDDEIKSREFAEWHGKLSPEERSNMHSQKIGDRIRHVLKFREEKGGGSGKGKGRLEGAVPPRGDSRPQVAPTDHELFKRGFKGK